MKSLVLIFILALSGTAIAGSGRSAGYMRAAEYFREDKRVYPRASRMTVKLRPNKTKSSHAAQKPSKKKKTAIAKLERPVKLERPAKLDKRKTRQPASIAQSVKKQKSQKKPVRG